MASAPLHRATSSSEPPAGDKQGQGHASAAYARMRPDRDQALVRARRAAEVTIPSLFRQDGETQQADLPVPWNTLGAYLVMNLAAKLGSALFPEGRSPMRLSQDQAARQAIQALPDPDQREQMSAAIDAGLVRVEEEFADAMEEDGDRSHLIAANIKMIVGGDHGFQFYPDAKLRGINLDRYVVRRDPSGTLLEFCIEDPLSFDSLPPDVREKVEDSGYNPDAANPKNIIMVYTWGRFSGGKWKVVQEVYGIPVEATTATYVPEALPYLFTPFQLLPGEDYGRSYVELYEGDLQTVEGGTQTVTEGSAAIARFIQFVHPGGLTNKKAVAEAPNGAVLSGRAEDVTTLLTNKGADFQSQQWVMEQAMSRLQRAFLVGERRQGERVTAEEIRANIDELQGQLAGVYSQQVVSFQTPYVRLKLAMLQRTGRVTKLPKGSVKVTLIGGLAALGRSADLQALDSLFAGAQQLFGPEPLSDALGPNAIRTYFLRRAIALGVNTDGIVPTQAQVEQMQQEKQAMQMAQQMGPEAIKQFGNNLTATEVADTNASAKIATSPQAQPQAAQ